ncbi:TPA: ABC transporter ATP-binding protein [Candidatus Campbellbacteria bacterium]|nr:MAG: ABC transporter-like protein [Candidatus Campbellbacteria bacterium GW2011_OD1_34_28]KKP75336.1 MAG: Amino acid/amide ABC transporter ATP-binding protein 1, HAAT family [Candidatus Campbellbacteria bacterium GW2011_GWD2_35_24]KKP76103.1 MAG: amino acid/amide ABC transporter ATP-binding protein 1, HAAT family [Candidatus Campbellbacteria bacterium GW2011_GWC2_35_28]KKP77292.1 MAG: Amino acid/amide ABC transporter ATP-binding protein 1, HAAT family [Candidatus Campbellbacteria bacterium GW
MNSILKTKKIIKHFDGVKAVDGLSVEIEKGKITGLIGPNGSGKTTLMNLLTGMFPFDGGFVAVDGVSGIKKIRSYDIPAFGITRTFQDVRLFEQMTVLDNILVVLTERNIVSALFERHKKIHHEKAKEVLERVGLWEKKNELAINLSYGQRKLLEIARALAMNSEIYFFDEPFAGLFPEMVKLVSGIIKELRTHGKTVVLIEHDMGLIRELCDYVFVMESGKLLAEGEPEKVLKNKDVIEAYLGE